MTALPSTEQTSEFSLSRDGLGRLVFQAPGAAPVPGVTPVRAFPIAAPDEGVSLVGPDGRELAWVPRLSALSQPAAGLIEEELRSREFMPEIRRLVSVSTFSTPSHWQVETDRGPTTLVLKVEEDIRRLPQRGRLLITSSHGVTFQVADLGALDRHSRRLLERFL